MVKQSTLKQADISHTNRVLIKKVVKVNHAWQYKDKGMCNRLGVIGVDVDVDMCVWYCLYICGNVLNVWNCTSCLNVPNNKKSYIYISIGLYNGLASNRQHLITGPNDGLNYWCMYASLTINMLTHWSQEMCQYIQKHNFQTHCTEYQLRHSLWSQEVTEEVKIVSGDGLVSSGTKPLPEPMLTQVCCFVGQLCCCMTGTHEWWLLHGGHVPIDARSSAPITMT